MPFGPSLNCNGTLPAATYQLLPKLETKAPINPPAGLHFVLYRYLDKKASSNLCRPAMQAQFSPENVEVSEVRRRRPANQTFRRRRS